MLARLKPWHSAKGQGPPLAGGGTTRSEVTVSNHNEVGTQMLGLQFFVGGE